MSKTKIKDMSADFTEVTPAKQDLEPKKSAKKADETRVEKSEEAAAETLLKETEKEIESETSSVIPSDSEESQDLNESGDSSAMPQNDKGEAKKEVAKREKGTAKPKKGQKIRSKKYKEKAELVEKTKLYPLNEAVEAAKSASFSKFAGTFEIHIKTNVKSLRGLTALPFVSGKKLTILAFGRDATDSGADIIGDDQTISDIQKGKLGFDAVVTTPEWMPKLAKAAAILGPRGLMPNPKAGTINDNLKKAVSDLQGGKMEYKTEKDGQVIHLAVGKTSQPSEEITQNIKVLLAAIGKSRVKKVSLSPTMGPAVKLDLSSI